MIQIKIKIKIIQKETMKRINCFILTHHLILLKEDKLTILAHHIKFTQIRELFNRETLPSTVSDPT